MFPATYQVRTFPVDRPIEKKRWTLKRIGKVGIPAAFFMFLLMYLLIGDHSSKLNVEAERITISTVTKAPFQEYIPVTGTIQPLQTFFLDAAEGGRIDSIFVEAGNVVSKGDRILKLANTNSQLDVLYREALLFEQINNARNTRLAIEQNSLTLRGQLADVEYQIIRLQRLHDRDTLLFRKQLISRQEFEQVTDEYEYWQSKQIITVENFKQDSLLRRVQLDQLNASIKRMQSNLDLVKRSLEDLVVRAPISGELTSLNAEIGQSKSPGQRLGQIDVLDGFKVRAEIDEFYISRINSGQKGTFDLGTTSYSLTVGKVYPEVREGRFEVDMLFEGSPPQGIRRGQTLQIRLQLGDLSDALIVARGAFYQKTGGQWAYVVDKSGAFAVKRNIRLGRQNPQTFEVMEGLEPGEQVITSAYDNFGDIDKLVLKK
jgi:HlyD family secretion protein